MEKKFYVHPAIRVVRISCVQTLLADSTEFSKTILMDYEEMSKDYWD